MTIYDWIRNRELRGYVTFSVEELKSAFGEKSAATIKTELSRLVKKGYISSVYRGFYVVVPVHYQLKGVVPPVYYIDMLMRYVGKPYYLSLLSAAAMYGAAHQQPMITQVTTIAPRIKLSSKNLLLNWNYRKVIPESFLLTKNGEMGVVRYSNPELTAIDLVQFADHIGGYQRASTVLAELVEAMDMGKVADVVPYTTIATLQRFGYLLEFVLEDQEMADALFLILKEQGKWNSISLRNDRPKKETAQSNRWHVNGNVEIEIDDL
jgi:predicted transcriptional regulator of viral defense system